VDTSYIVAVVDTKTENISENRVARDRCWIIEQIPKYKLDLLMKQSSINTRADTAD